MEYMTSYGSPSDADEKSTHVLMSGVKQLSPEMLFIEMLWILGVET